jgi:hypothetical protein
MIANKLNTLYRYTITRSMRNAMAWCTTMTLVLLHGVHALALYLH